MIIIIAIISETNINNKIYIRTTISKISIMTVIRTIIIMNRETTRENATEMDKITGRHITIQLSV